MKRRIALGVLGAISGHAMFPVIVGGFAVSCSKNTESSFKPVFFNRNEVPELKRIIDYIIPEILTGSASQSKVEEFIDGMLANCLNDERKMQLRSKIISFFEKWASQEDELEFLTELDRKSFESEDFEHFRK